MEYINESQLQREYSVLEVQEKNKHIELKNEELLS